MEMLLKKFQAFGAVAVKLAAVGPPEDVVMAQVSLAVARVAAADSCLPVTPDEFLSGNIPPAPVLSLIHISEPTRH